MNTPSDFYMLILVFITWMLMFRFKNEQKVRNTLVSFLYLFIIFFASVLIYNNKAQIKMLYCDD